jgi:hypothetical protein
MSAMSADLEMAGWAALTAREAREVAERIAEAVDGHLVVLLPHTYRGRSVRLALFDRGGVLYSLVPGGEVRVGSTANGSRCRRSWPPTTPPTPRGPSRRPRPTASTSSRRSRPS